MIRLSRHWCWVAVLVSLGCGREPASPAPAPVNPPSEGKVQGAAVTEAVAGPAELDEAEREALYAAYHRQRCVLDGLLDRSSDAEGGKLAVSPDALATRWEQAARSDPAWAASMVRRSIEHGCGAAVPAQESEDVR